MALQYNLDKGSALGSFADFVHAQNYSDAFEHALLNSAPDQTGKVGQVDIKNLDLYGENFDDSGYDAAYISTYNAADSTSQTALDNARIILFDKSVEDVDLDLAGSKSHFIGLTAGDDSITISGSSAQIVDAGAGDNFVQTGKGNDLIMSGDGDDIVLAGRGNDTIYGGGGADHLSGERGDDSIIGGGGDATIDGGSGFDVAVVDGAKADFHYVGHAWVSSETGDQIGNVEYTQLSDDSVLITVASDHQAALARLFQAVNNQDPTAADYKSALVALNNGDSLENIAKTMVDKLDGDTDLGGADLTSAAAKKTFVTEVIGNLFDGSAGAWKSADVDSYVSSLPNWSKAKIVADLVTKISAADDHIGIHIDTTTT
jgi:Ca2+-binding RTX toxin-like protein